MKGDDAFKVTTTKVNKQVSSKGKRHIDLDTRRRLGKTSNKIDFKINNKVDNKVK